MQAEIVDSDPSVLAAGKVALPKTRPRWCAPMKRHRNLFGTTQAVWPLAACWCGAALSNIWNELPDGLQPRLLLGVPAEQHDLQLANVALTVSCLMDSGPKASRLNNMTCSCSMAACCSSSVLLERRRCMRSMAACSSCTGTGTTGCHGCPAANSSAALNACCAACPATQAQEGAMGLQAPHGRLL